MGSPVLVERGPDAGLVWHSGDPLREQTLLESGAAWVRLANRGVLSVSGPDRLAFLHSLTSQHFTNVSAGDAVTALVLSPTGHIEHVLYGVDDGSRFVAFTEPGPVAFLVAWLDSMRFMMRVEVSDLTAEREVWFVPGAGFLTGDARADDAPASDGLPSDVVVRASDVPGFADAIVPRGLPGPSGLTEAGTWALDALRIAAGVPRIGVDTDARTIPNEIGLIGTHLDKGCYRGQETVARVHTLGRPPRRLVRLHLDGSGHSVPEAGAQLSLDGRPVGFVGSAALHHELGPIGLGLVKRNVPVDAVLTAGDIAAAQDVLVDPEVGEHVRPKLG